MIVSYNVQTAPTIAVAYRDDDKAHKNPCAHIVRINSETFRAEGYRTGLFVAEGTLSDCVAAIRDYGKGSLSYGDPDTDWGLLSVW